MSDDPIPLATYGTVTFDRLYFAGKVSVCVSDVVMVTAGEGYCKLQMAGGQYVRVIGDLATVKAALGFTNNPLDKTSVV